MRFTVTATLLLGLSVASSAAAQRVTETQARDFFTGRQMLVTYRQGGPVYGTFFALQVHFCRSGRYITLGESRKQTVLGNEQVNRFTDEGTWIIDSVRGQPVLRSLSISGQPTVVAINVSANGRVTLGDGSISVMRQGPAQCPR